MLIISNVDVCHCYTLLFASVTFSTGAYKVRSTSRALTLNMFGSLSFISIGYLKSSFTISETLTSHSRKHVLFN